MTVQTIAVTATPLFLRRYRFLYDRLADHAQRVDLVPCGDVSSHALVSQAATFAQRVVTRLRPEAAALFEYNPNLFVARSKTAERRLLALEHRPDLVFQVFALFSPVWDRTDLPYVMYLDYTAALACRNYPPWAPSVRHGQRERWMACEQRVYSRAAALFTMSELVRESLIADYHVPPARIHVVGASGMFTLPDRTPKMFGTRKILFNGTDFDRKGGPLALAAFREVRRQSPDARLVVLGRTKLPAEPGVERVGFISSADVLRKIFAETDLVIAPGQCDPFPSFVIEAMNYGVPCIVSPRDGMPEMVDDGRAGVVLPTLDVSSLAAEIGRLLNSPAELSALSRAARQTVAMRLNWGSVSHSIARYINAL